MRLNDTAAPSNRQALFIVASSGGTPRRITSWNSTPAVPTGRRTGRRSSSSPIATARAARPRRSTRCVGRLGLTRLTSARTEHRAELVAGRQKIVYAHQPGDRRGRSSPTSGRWTRRHEQDNRHPDQAMGERAGLGTRAAHLLTNEASACVGALFAGGRGTFAVWSCHVVTACASCTGRGCTSRSRAASPAPRRP